MRWYPPLLALPLLLLGCPKKEGGGGLGVPRCEADLSGLAATEGEGAFAKIAESEADLIGGPWAHGELGDAVIGNGRIRAIIQRPLRAIGPQPYGGNLIDADVARPEGEAGSDQFGKMGILYAFGRTSQAKVVEVLADGGGGGSAIVAATGMDAVNDYLSVQNLLYRVLDAKRLKFAVDPEQPLPLRSTTYYVLSPGESRVRILTALCNDGEERVLAPVGDLVDRGGSIDFFNPDSCASAMGTGDSCFIDPSPWFGYQGDGVAYALRGYRLDDPSIPETANALLTVSGVSATLAGGEGPSGVLSWVDSTARRRPGVFVIPAHSARVYLRDFHVASDLGAITSDFAQIDQVARGSLRVTVKTASGSPAPGARVQVVAPSTGKMVTVLVADALGEARAELPEGSYRVTAGLLGHSSSIPADVAVAAGGSAASSLGLRGSARLKVTVRDPYGLPIPAKVTLLCPSGACPTSSSSYRAFYESEVLPSEVAAVGFVPPTGYLELSVSPGSYEVLVTRGPEFSAWPDTWPLSGEKLDLSTAAEATLSATLARVIDTAGWVSSDLHVHSVNSPDASVRNEVRVLNFAAEGVDILCSTDHDYITDFSQAARAVGAEGVLATMVGAEITPFDWGHYNAFPVAVRDGPNGGAFDWAGGDGPTQRPEQMMLEVRSAFPEAVLQMNHPRGPIGSLTLLRVDTATLASHAPPGDFRMEGAPDASPEDTRLFSDAFDAMEVQTGAFPSFRVLNDWMTFLSRGTVRAATANSDTHQAFVYQGGYPRTYVETAVDSPSLFDATAFAQALRGGKAIGTNGPFLRVTARRLDAAGQPAGPEVGIGGTASLNPAAGERLRVDVDIQAAEWMTFDSLELYAHAPGREATDGQDNAEWPDSRILQRKALSAGAQALEPVVVNGLTFRRLHLRESFTVAPTADDWYVVMLRSSDAARTLFPLHFAGVQCTGGTCAAKAVRPFAFTNPIFVDADGTGAYDRFPLRAPRSLPLRPQVPKRALSAGELIEALRDLVRRH
ncbi:MAG: CehA/McbA family metallohydrolase [Myxococcales bacterium]|nr:CehA/McbA family metallohydrolase [Myxococcales bacterium]